MFVAEEFGHLLQLLLVSVFDRTSQVGGTARLGKRIHWGNNDEGWIRERALDWVTRHCATDENVTLSLESVDEDLVKILDRQVYFDHNILNL